MADAPASVDPRVVIPDHLIGWGPVQFHSRYIVDAGLIMAGVGALFVSLFLISEPDVSSLIKKAVATGAKLAPLAV